MTKQQAKVILEAEIVHHSEYSIIGEALALSIEALEEADKIKADAIEEYKEQLLKDLIPLKNKYFDIARGTAMPERYTHLKRMDTVDMIIETVNLIAEQLKEKNKITKEIRNVG